MINKYRFINYITISACAMVIGSACKSGIRVEHLSLPKGIMEDAQESYFKADSAQVNQNYAAIDTGDTVDGFAISDPTDAERIIQAGSGVPLHVFIELPPDAHKTEHILRSLSAASIRLALHKSKVSSIKVLNTQYLQKMAADLNLDDVQRKAYSLSVAQKLNEQVSADDVIIIKLDELMVTPKEFMEQLNKPHVIGLSQKSIDHFAPFSEVAHQEFLALGLNPGHVYKMTEAFFQQHNAGIDAAMQTKMTLYVTKIISALEPNTKLGSLAKLFSLLGKSIKKDSTRASLENDIIRDVASFYETSSKYLSSLDLDARSLSNIQDKTKENALAFHESMRKLDKILKYSGTVRSIVSPGFEEIRRNVAQTKSDVADLRQVDLPQMQRELTEHGEAQRDDVIASTKRQLSDQAQRLINDNASRHEATQKSIESRTQRVVDDARDQITKNTNDTMEVLAQNMADVRESLSKKIAQTESALKEDALDKHHSTERGIKKGVATLIDSAQAQNIQHSQEMAEEIKEAMMGGLTKAIERISSSQAESVKGLKDDIDAKTRSTVNNARQVLIEALREAGEQIKKDGREEHILTREEAKKALVQGLAQAQDTLKKDADIKHTQTASHIVRKAQELAFAAQDELSEKLTAMGQAVQERVLQTLVRMMEANANLAADIKKSTEAVVKKEGRLRKEELVSMGEEVGQIVRAEADKVVNELGKMPEKNRVHTARIGKAIAAYMNFLTDYTVEYIRQRLRVRNNLIEETPAADGGTGAVMRVTQPPVRRIQMQDIEQATRLGTDEESLKGYFAGDDGS